MLKTNESLKQCILELETAGRGEVDFPQKGSAIEDVSGKSEEEVLQMSYIQKSYLVCIYIFFIHVSKQLTKEKTFICSWGKWGIKLKHRVGSINPALSYFTYL